MRRLLLALLPAGLLLQLAASLAPAIVERVFSQGLARVFGRALSCLTSVVPFSVAEVLLGTALGWLLWRVLRSAARIRRGESALAPSVRRGLRASWVAAGTLYLAFLLVWGLHYQRQPFARAAGLDTRPAAVEELEAVAAELVARADSFRSPLGEDGRGVMQLEGGSRAALLRTAAGFEKAAALYTVLDGRCARPKPVAASILMSYLGISGIYFPFTGEANVNTSVLDPELPFSASHEVAHQRGFAREDEANYLGYLACRLHPDAAFRYSGTLAASVYALGALAAVDAAAARRVAATRTPAVRRDLEAIAAWEARFRGPAMDVAARVNSAYLRSQGQREGLRSYGRMVDLLIAERRSAGAESAR